MRKEIVPAKIRRHGYSRPALSVASRLECDRRESWGFFDTLGEAVWSTRSRGEEGDFEAFKMIAEGRVGWSYSNLPEGAHAIGWTGLMRKFAKESRGFISLEGVEAGAAGLEGFRRHKGVDRVGKAFSFCMNGATFTLFEEPIGRGGGKLGEIVEREGNFCARKFPPVPLSMRVVVDAYDEDGWAISERVDPRDARAGTPEYVEFIDPSAEACVVGLGQRWNEWDASESFEGWMYAEALDRAMESELSKGAALARDLEKSLPCAESETPKRPRGSRL
jgi:hypothetical protein